jgi:ubiquinone/menaquinone biosynthesis C-methylase UbiE
MQSKVRSLNLNELHIQQANARFLPFSDHTFDLVISFRFLHLFSMDDQKILLGEMHRVVKPGGKVLIEYNNTGALWVGGVFHNLLRMVKRQKPLHRQSENQLRALYKDFRIARIQGFSWPLVGTVARLSPELARSLLRLSMKKRLQSTARYIWVESMKLPVADMGAISG